LEFISVVKRGKSNTVDRGAALGEFAWGRTVPGYATRGNGNFRGKWESEPTPLFPMTTASELILEWE